MTRERLFRAVEIGVVLGVALFTVVGLIFMTVCAAGIFRALAG